MRVFGIDFTSAPRRRKPITCVDCELQDDLLIVRSLIEWADFEGFEGALQEPGPWIAGIDFPFGQASRFIETIGWPKRWADYVAYAHGLGRANFRAALDGYRTTRLKGDKEHRRRTDFAAGSISPQKLFGVPVGLMFYEGAARVLRTGATVPSLLTGDPHRVVVEAYPGVLARQIIGRRSYKQDTRSKQTAEHAQARRDVLDGLRNGILSSTHGIFVDAPDSLCEDPGADRLDALLCAVQAAWSWRRRFDGFGAPADGDPNEGWIADPTLSGYTAPTHLIEKQAVGAPST
ncbi:DUF429 domain-containing protein [Sinorhizobium medicae]|nr:DUF429 domain-containing protein [Sinorhizobium medicae]MDX0796480.1 DUF429 domain-containing protein [Sinorhizobium medicae]